MSGLLAPVLPEHRFSERHRTWFDASHEAALAAATEMSPGEHAAGMAAVADSRHPNLGRGPLGRHMPAGGLVDLGEIPGCEVAGGVIGQMWKLSGGGAPRIAGGLDVLALN